MYHQSAAKEDAESSPRYASLIKQTILINVLILILVVLAVWSQVTAFLGALLVLGYLVLASLQDPKRGFFLIFGVKLTYDAFWNVGKDLAGASSIHLLSLFLIPVAVLTLVGPRVSNRSFGRPLFQVGFYLLWVLMAMLVNGSSFNIETFIRQTSIFLGLLIGLKYIRDEEDFNQLALQIFLSTIIPVMATLFQFAMVSSGQQVLYFTFDSTRGFRYCGLYYDAATNGMACVIALLSSAYLIKVSNYQGWRRQLHVAFLALTFFSIILGATRSILIISTTALLAFTASNLRKSATIIPLLLVVIYFGKPYIDNVYDRITKETRHQIIWSELLTNHEFRGLLSGRVSLWQEVMDDFSQQSWLQQALGSGKLNNAHSSYFFLLMQIGWCGVIYYTLFNLNMLYRFLTLGKIASSSVMTASLFLLSAMLLGISANVVVYTSFQWTVYLVLGGMMNVIAAERYQQTTPVRYPLARQMPVISHESSLHVS